MTYNIRACLGLDRVRSIERIAQVIDEAAPDVIALQEVDFQRARSGAVNQASEIARLLRLHWTAGESFQDDDGGAYGNAILTRAPIEHVRHGALPASAGGEPRSILRIGLRINRVPLDIITTHLSFRRRERTAQIDTLCGDTWLGDIESVDRVVLCGDLNCAPRDPGFRRLTTTLHDAQTVNQRPRTTWPTRRPFRRLDHILVSPTLSVVSATTLSTPTSRVASDHYPVVAEIHMSDAPQ